MTGFVNLIAVFTLTLTGEAACRLHERSENEMNKRTQFYKFDLLQFAEQLDINAPTLSNYDPLAPPSGD